MKEKKRLHINGVFYEFRHSTQNKWTLFKIHEMIRQTSDNFLVCDNVKWNQIARQIEEPLNIIKHNQTWIFVSYQPMWLTLREYIRILIDNFVIKLSTLKPLTTLEIGRNGAIYQIKMP